jgi:CHRD domain
MQNLLQKRSAAAAWSGALAIVATCVSMSAMSETLTLAGVNEVPPVQTVATGQAMITIGADKSVKAEVAVSGMNANASHIHMGAAGTNGPVIVPFKEITPNKFVAAPDAHLTDEQYAAYKAGNLYVNVHSITHPGGEIRAQIK